MVTNGKPIATHYTLFEGGPWHIWQEDCPDAGDMFAIKFADGWIWDGKVGWRLSYEKEKEYADAFDDLSGAGEE